MKQVAGIILLSCFFIAGQQVPPSVVIPPIHVHLHSNINTSATAGNNTQVNTENTNTIENNNTQIQEVTQVQQPSLNEQMMSAYSLIVQYLKENWLLCTAVTVGTLYASLITYIWYAHYRIYHKHTWSTWQKHSTLEELMQQPSATLKATLVKHIASVYMNQQNPADPISPLTAFVVAYHKEEAELKKYLKIAGLIKKTPLYRILPTLQDEYAQNALTRLTFVYHLFVSWSADLTWEQLNAHGSSNHATA